MLVKYTGTNDLTINNGVEEVVVSTGDVIQITKNSYIGIRNLYGDSFELVSEGDTHYTLAAGTYTTVGGAATEAISITGVLATDIAIVTMNTQGAAPVTLLASAADVDEIDLTFSADPSTDHVVNYMVLRAV